MSEKRKDNKGRNLRTGEVQRADGKYMFRYNAPDGSRKTIYSWKLVDTDKVPQGKRCSSSLREMERQIQKDLDDGILSYEANKTTINDLFEIVMSLKIRLKESTRIVYRRTYDTHIRNVFGSRKINSIKSSEIQKYYLHLMSKRNLSSSTITRIHTLIYQVFEYAVNEDLIRSNAADSAMKALKNNIEFTAETRHSLTEEQQERLVDWIYRDKYYSRYAPMITTLLGTGMRIGELSALQWEDCDFETEIISIKHSLYYGGNKGEKCKFILLEPKSKAGYRQIPMLAGVKESLLKIRLSKNCTTNFKPEEQYSIDGYTNFVFVNSHFKPYYPSNLYIIISNIGKKYNAEESKAAEMENREACLLPKLSPHIFRHTFCTRFCENETNIKVIQEILGHSSAAITMDIYNEATQKKKKEGIKNLEGKIKIL